MNIIELPFTLFGPLFYNGIFLGLWLLWFMYNSKEDGSPLRTKFTTCLKNPLWFYLITSGFIILFLFLLLSYAIQNTDVDDAITSGVQAFLAGSNPYKEEVVEHHLPSGIIYGFYHYFPPDLLSYSIFYLLGGSLLVSILATYWFVPFHFILLIPSYWFVSRIVAWPNGRRLPFFGLLVSPFLFTNSILMLFFFLIGYYLYEIQERHNLGMTFYVLAASIKYMVGFIVLFYLIEKLRLFPKEGLSTSKWTYIRTNFGPYFLSGITLAIFSLPFGLIDVIIAVFFYQGLLSFRSEVAQSQGPLLIELIRWGTLDTLYIGIVVIILIGAFFIVRNQSTYSQILHFSFLAMIILPFYATELFITVPFYWWFKEGQDVIIEEWNVSDQKTFKSPP
ncbi:MAG: hypothetical protein ACFFFG_03635 [Candidatus Thorarchaeota archaeon]